jgi:hypothetical protein
MFAVLHRYALDSLLLVLNSDFLLLTFLGQLHPRDLPPKTFFVSSQVKYVARIDSQLALISVSDSFSNSICAGHRTRQHCALSAKLTVSQLSKSDNEIETEFLPLTD